MIDKLPDICDNIGAAITLIDDNYKILDINHELVWKGKVTKEFAVGKNFLNFFPGEHREKVKEMLENVRKKGMGRGVAILNSPSGKNFWIYLRLSKIDGGFVVTIVDITKMVNEHIELTERHEELEMVNRFVKEISSTLDIEEICDKAYGELSNIVKNMDAFIISLVDEDKGEIWAEYVVGEGKKYEKRKFPLSDKDTLSGWVAIHREELYIRNINRDKLPSHYKLIGTPMLTWLGIPMIHGKHVLGVLSVQSRKESAFSERDIRLIRLIAGQLSIAISNAIIHRNLRRSEELYRTLVNNSLIGIVTVDANVKLTFVNRAFADMLGYKQEEMIGKTIYQFATKKGRISLSKGHERRVRGLTDTYEAELRRKDGSKVPVIIYASPLKDGKGNITGSIGAIADISQIKKMENKLRESNDFFKLLLHVIGHDLKTPLSVISGYAELISEEPDPEYGKEIKRAVDRASTIISDIRLLLRMEMSGNGNVREEYSLKEVMMDTVAIVREKYPEAKIEISGEEEKLCGSKLLMREALVNIMLNAFQYGSTEVKITSEKKDGKIILKLADNGSGINDERKEKIFEPFVKFEAGGSGLGLHIVMKVISLHHGKIWVEDNIPKGSVFIIELPIGNKCE